MDGAAFKKIRVKLKLSAAALGHALGYRGADANIARTIYPLESDTNQRAPYEQGEADLVDGGQASGPPDQGSWEFAAMEFPERCLTAFENNAAAAGYQELAAQAHQEFELAMQCGQVDHAAYLQHRRAVAAAYAMHYRDGEGDVEPQHKGDAISTV
jgi:hypothetical protein